MNTQIESAVKKYDDAAKDLVSTIKDQYPLGTLLEVEIGRSTLTISVIGYGSWWATPEYLRGTNIDTGKVRKFSCNAITGLVSRADPRARK